MLSLLNGPLPIVDSACWLLTHLCLIYKSVENACLEGNLYAKIIYLWKEGATAKADHLAFLLKTLANKEVPSNKVGKFFEISSDLLNSRIEQIENYGLEMFAGLSTFISGNMLADQNIRQDIIKVADLFFVKEDIDVREAALEVFVQLSRINSQKGKQVNS